MSKRSPLTKTQRIILTAAAGSAIGIRCYAGDRRGTRVSGRDELGRPTIVAYQSPEFFLKSRGLLEMSNERHVYRITDKGRDEILGREL